ncbi:YfhE family protein [Bacillus sp. CGMCC 1.16541]|nr:YfhE family protein [Bacillus sp. CGMCC 1.16541]
MNVEKETTKGLNKEKSNNLTSTQEVLYQSEFKKADKAASDK